VTSAFIRVAPAAIGVGLLLAAATAVTPAVADTAPATDCRTDCTAVFDTAGLHTLAVPAGVVSLRATVSGAAGSPAPAALGLFPDAVGGPGGVTTAMLGTALGGTTLTLRVGAAGEGSALANGDGALLVVAGGGGDGGYAGRFELPDQLFAAYPGGAGGAPSAPGVAPGGDGTTFGTGAFNGAGGALAAGGAGGVGGASGSAGAAGTTSSPGAIGLSAGGAGGILTVQDDQYEAGPGGSGFTGGGGGAVSLDAVDGGDEIMIDVVGAGGGGSGFLAEGLSAVAGEPNAGAGSVTVVWSLPPLPDPEPASPVVAPPAEPTGPQLAETGVEGPSLGLAAAAIAAAGAALLALHRRRRRA